MKSTYLQLEIELAKTKAELAETKAELAETKRRLDEATQLLKQALEEITNLKEQLKLNSKNSSRPPSTDYKANTATKEHKKRMPREGIARSACPPERVDKRINCTLEMCPHCGSHALLSMAEVESLQQSELPEARAIVTEYLLHKYCCNHCGKRSKGNLPKGVPDSAFGPRLMGLFATLTGVLHMARREAIQLMSDLYDVDIGLGSAPNIEERVSRALDPVYRRIHSLVIESALCKHFDETSWRDSGKRFYAWIASCSLAAYFKLHPNRSRQAFEELLGKNVDSFIAVTDRYPVYATIGKLHQYCLAHLIRDFRRYAERDGPDGEIGKALTNNFAQVCRIHKQWRTEELSLRQQNMRIGYCKRQVEFWLFDGIANGSDQLSRLCEKLFDEFDKLWVFTKIEDMEPTNNLAKRDLRKLVIWRKKSFGTRSRRGIKFVERITSVAETVKRHGNNVLRFIQDAIMQFYANKPTPYICKSLGI